MPAREARLQRAEAKHPRQVLDPGAAVAEMAVKIGRGNGIGPPVEDTNISCVRQAVAKREDRRIGGRGCDIPQARDAARMAKPKRIFHPPCSRPPRLTGNTYLTALGAVKPPASLCPRQYGNPYLWFGMISSATE